MDSQSRRFRPAVVIYGTAWQKGNITTQIGGFQTFENTPFLKVKQSTDFPHLKANFIN